MANKGGFIGQDGLNAPDEPTSVSATAGDTQATVSFTAPSDVGGSAITGYQVQSNNGDGTWETYYDIANASYDSKSFSVVSQETNQRGITFKSDGTEMYVVGLVNDTVYQYTLSTAWDISTASYSSKSFSVASQDTFPTSIQFKSDGTKMFMVGQQTSNVRQYSLSSAWDVSTASYDSVSFSVGTQVGGSNVNFLFFSADGTKMYAGGNTNQTIFQYTLSSAWDLSTASYASKSFSVASQETDPRGIFFKSDGSVLFVVGINDDEVLQYSLSSSWDVSTASFDNISFSVASQDLTPVDVHFSSDGSNMFISGLANDSVFQYATAQLDYPTASPVTITGLTNGTSYTFNVWAINAFGWSAPSDASGSVSPSEPRGVFAGGVGGGGILSDVIDYVSISTTGNATDFGDLTTATREIVSYGSNGTRAVFGLGYTDISNPLNTLEYVTINSAGNATDFGDATVGRRLTDAGFSNSTRGVNGGGRSSSVTSLDVIDYITIATTGNATDFGNLTVGRNELSGLASPTRGIFAGGGSNPKNTIDYITIASTGNATDFGDLTQGQNNFAGLSSNTRGVFGGGEAAQNVMQYITIASTGNSTDFGDLTRSTYHLAGTSSSTRGVFGGGATFSNIIDYITIATTGNATDYGDLTVGRQELGATSSAHGGLS